MGQFSKVIGHGWPLGSTRSALRVYRGSPMALTATVYHLKITLADVDRQVYADLDLRIARHPSETGRNMVLRALAHALSYEEGITFSKGGISSTDEAPVAVFDLQGTLRAWIDVGVPSADRLHKASKACDRVSIFTASPDLVKREAGTRAIHRAERIEVFAIEPSVLDAIDAATSRNTQWEVTRTGGQLYVNIAGGPTVDGTVTQFALTDPT